MELMVISDLLASEHGLVTVATLRRDGAPLTSVVNAGPLCHPITGADSVAFVSAGRAARLGHLRRDPRITITARRMWDWASVDGTAELIGPADPLPGFDQAGLPALLRQIFLAAGGQHDDFDEFDAVMAAEKRTAVIVTPERVNGNSPSMG